MPEESTPRRERKRTVQQMVVVGIIAAAIGITIGLTIHWFPPADSTQADKVDTLWDVLIIATVPVFVLVTVIVCFAVIEFRMRPGEENLDGQGSDDLKAGFPHFAPSAADTGAINVEPFPAEAVVPYSARGVMARKTFRSGRVPTDPDHIHFGQGTDPSDETTGQQSTWTFSTTVRGAITLTPAKPVVNRRPRRVPARR